MSRSDSEDELPLSQRAAINNNLSGLALPNTTPSIPVKKEEPSEYVITAKASDEDTDDDMPLAQRLNGRSTKRSGSVKSESDDDEIPLAKKRKKLSLSKPKVKKEASSNGKRKKESDDKPLAKRGKKETTASSTSAAAKKAKIKEEQEAEIYKWWEEQEQKGMAEDDTIKWTKLEHNGVLFPPDYVPHGVKMKYDGKPISLSPEAEEVASFYAALLETDHGKNPTFQKNFFNDWQKILKKDPQNPKITSFEKCDFRPIWEKFEQDKEKKKQLTKEEKLRIKQEKEKLEEPYLYAYVDNRKEKVGNFRIEPPGLFRGRGAHPKTGMLKQRVLPEQVTLNLSKDAKVPPAPPGHKWAKIVHDQTATWLATWKENVNGTIKYVFLAQSSAWKGQSDMQKFDKARELKDLVGKIRKDYTSHLKDQNRLTRQRATAMYLIDRLALRAGNEKGDDEADTVGCCSLRAEHIELESPNTLHFDFLGKDSIRYVNSVAVETQVFKNIKQFKADALKRYAEAKKKNPKGEIDPLITSLFDDLSTGALNKHLNSYMKGLSAKVFRTYNASHTFQKQLEKLTNKEESIPDKMLSFNRANRDVAVLCNHQRAAPKGHEQQMGRIQDRIRALKYQRMKIRKQIFELDAKYKKIPEYAQAESDLEDDWIAEHEEMLINKERERVKNKFAKQNEKRKEANEPLLPESQLKDDLKAVDEMAKRLAKERKTGRSEPKPSATVEKLINNLTKLDQRIAAVKVQATDKEENKEIALGTSKMNYIDPRISISWCKKYDVPVEKVFNKTLLEKFRWAQTVGPNWKF
ncbi:hypothetical protein LRAMOSA02743 [Lichtheimia ramosa]|uniref:DNA topoisomerase I n=1 Tax=Lichtheimia ramosa TaxID=688394 RepID=A0A077WR42_9FUNG|nr:hypothetical protein LRAMOSA02743 [Lichtheimia ramosa]